MRPSRFLGWSYESCSTKVLPISRLNCSTWRKIQKQEDRHGTPAWVVWNIFSMVGFNSVHCLNYFHGKKYRNKKTVTGLPPRQVVGGEIMGQCLLQLLLGSGTWSRPSQGFPCTEISKYPASVLASSWRGEEWHSKLKGNWSPFCWPSPRFSGRGEFLK